MAFNLTPKSPLPVASQLQPVLWWMEIKRTLLGGALGFTVGVVPGVRIVVAVRVAEAVAVAVANADAHALLNEHARNMELAMQSRAVIEQAKGVLMAQRHVDADAAFEILRDASQRYNRKLRDIAVGIVESTRAD